MNPSKLRQSNLFFGTIILFAMLLVTAPLLFFASDVASLHCKLKSSPCNHAFDNHSKSHIAKENPSSKATGSTHSVIPNCSSETIGALPCPVLAETLLDQDLIKPSVFKFLFAPLILLVIVVLSLNRRKLSLLSQFQTADLIPISTPLHKQKITFLC